MTEKMKILRDNKQCCADTLTDFSKAYDLLIAKLNANSFDPEALKLINSYLIDNKNWELGSSFSKELDIFCCFLKGQCLVYYYVI